MFKTRKSDGRVFNDNKQRSDMHHGSVKPTDGIKTRNDTKLEGMTVLPDVHIREKNWGIEIRNGKIWDLNLGNLTDAGWFWNSRDKDTPKDFAGFIVRAMKSNFTSEFAQEMDSHGLSLETMKPALIKAINTGNANYEISGDNSRWKFGNDEPDLDYELRENERFEKLTEEQKAKVREEVWNHYDIDFDEFNKRYGKYLIANFVKEVEQTSDWKDLAKVFESPYALNAEEHFSEYQNDKLNVAISKAIESVKKESK